MMDTSFYTFASFWPTNFVEGITINVKAGSPNTSIGIIVYGNYAKIAFNLAEYTSLRTLLFAIYPRLYYLGGFNVSITNALHLLLSSAQDGSLGLRENTSNIAIVIVASPESVEGTTKQLHKANIFDVHAVGLERANLSSLQEIASDPSFIHYLKDDNPSNIIKLQQSVLNKLCTSKLSITIHTTMYICVYYV